MSELGWYRRLYSLSQAFEPGTYFFERMKRKMKLDKLVGERFKEKPSDCVIDSHALMLRGGYMKNVANGIYSQFMPLRRITKKIELS